MAKIFPSLRISASPRQSQPTTDDNTLTLVSDRSEPSYPAPMGLVRIDPKVIEVAVSQLLSKIWQIV